MTKEEALKLALEALESSRVFVMSREMIKQPEGADWYDNRITEIKEALAQPEQDDRRLQIAMRQWEDWKTYALELQKKLVKYEGGSPMLLNTQPVQEPVAWEQFHEHLVARNFCPRCGKRTAGIHTCTPPQ